MDLFGTLKSRGMRERIRQQRQQMFRLAMAWCGDCMLADDLTQQALLQALSNIGQLRDPERLNHWLMRILNNCWRDHLRRRHPTEQLDDLVLVDEDSPERVLRRQQVAERVQAAIQCLPLGQRQVVTLVDIQGCSYAEVAEILDIPRGTVMSRLSRARDSLRQQLLSLEGELSARRCYIRRVK